MKKKNKKSKKQKAMLRSRLRHRKESYNKKLTPDQVEQVRGLIEEGYVQESIADEFGVSQSMISRIKNGEL